MFSSPRHHRAGMTLIELLVVLMIVGLLAVAVAPVLVGNKDKRAIQRAADIAESQISHVVSKAIGSPSGAALWLEAETTGAGANYAVVDLGFARIPLAASGTATIGARVITTGSAPLSFASALPTSLMADLPAPIEFAGIPGSFTADQSSGILTLKSGTTNVTGSVNRNSRNAPLPTTALPSQPITAAFSLHLPPRPSTSSPGESLEDGMCVDLSSSSLGIPGLSTTVTSLSGFTRVALCFDRTGRPDCVWMSPTGGSWSRMVITEAAPILLLIGPRAQIGAPWVSIPDENNPGLVWQNPYARWVIVDPKTGGARVVEVGSSKGAATQTVAETAALASAVETFTSIDKR